MQIPTIFPSAIQQNDLDDLIHIGFCYIQLSDEKIIENIHTCLQVAREFFRLNTQEKTKWQLKEILEPGDRYQGYALRSQTKNTNAIEQIFFEPDAPFGPYESYAPLIQSMNDCFISNIFLLLMNAIFKHLGLSYADFIDATTHPNRSLVFQSCPMLSEQKSVIRLNAHKDFGLLTILFFEEPGLEVKYQEIWKAIPPQKGCLVVNLGNALELMTGGRCHSAVHRVTNATDNRISSVYFINPNYQRPVKNYMENKVIAQTGEMFFKQQFIEYYQVDH